MPIVSFSSVKGGVSKTSTCVNLAYCIATQKKRYKILVVDLDSQGGATKAVKTLLDGSVPEIAYYLENKISLDECIFEHNSRLHFIKGSMDTAFIDESDLTKGLQNIVNTKQKEYDFIFFDLPPAIFAGALIPLSFSDFILVPFDCQGGLSMSGVLMQIDLLKRLEQKGKAPKLLGILACFKDKTKISKQAMEWAKEEFNSKLFNSNVRRSVIVTEASTIGKPVKVYRPKSKVSMDYTSVSKEFLRRVKELSK